jgi:glutathione S-transferase
MLLYQDPRAPNPRRVRMFMAEKDLGGRGISVELIEVSINASENRSAAHLARHPLGLLPVLELGDGRVLRESMAICRFLEETYPDPPLFGVDAWDRAQVEMWNRHAELELLFPVAQVFRNTHAFWTGRIKQSPEFGEIMRELVEERMTWLDRELGQRRFLAGDAFTVADITAVCALDFGKISNLRISDDRHRNLARWHAEVKARPSYKA